MKDLLTISREANALLMKFKPKENDLILLVEGKSDRILFSKFIVSKKKILISGCSGNPNLLSLVDELKRRDFNSMIAILDKDFGELDNELIDDELIFYSDYHDIEISILESNALNVLFEKYANEEKLNSFEEKFKCTYKDYIYKLASYIGYLKWSNKLDNLGLAFKPRSINDKNLKLEKIFDINLKYLGDERLITYARQYSSNRGTDLKNYQEVLDSYNTHKVKEVDFFQLCNGHDLSYIIALSIKKIVSNVNVTHEDIENDLRLSYDSNCFKKTVLYKSIKEWEVENVPVFI